MKGFNLARFKKIKEDKDWATLIHKDGHQIVIAKAPLSAIQRKQLESLEMHDQNGQYAQGGKVIPHYDEGTASAGGNDRFQQDQSSLPATPDQVAAMAALDEARANLSVARAPDSMELRIANQKAAEAQDQSALQGAGTTSSDVPVQTQIPPAPTQQQSAATSVPNPAVAPSPFQAKFQSQIPGYEAEKTANLSEAKALTDQGNQEAKAYGDAAKDLNDLPSQSEIVNANKKASDDLFNAYESKKLDPDKYWNNHSKITAGIGVLLSGLGQAVGSGAVGNDALSMINTQINREIDRQKNDQTQAGNLWKMNREALGTDLAANLATENQLLTATKYKISQAGSQNSGPIALAKAQAANARIDQQIGLNSFKLSLLNPTSDNQDPASRIQLLGIPEGRQQKVADEINAAKNTVSNAPGILEAFDQAAKEVRPLTGGTGTSLTAFVPGVKSAGQSALQARLGPTFQDVEGTVRQAAMDNLDHNVTPKFGDDDATIATKRKSLIDYMRSKSAASSSKSFGIDLQKYPSTNTLAIGQKPQFTRQIINGKAYMVPVR